MVSMERINITINVTLIITYKQKMQYGILKHNYIYYQTKKNYNLCNIFWVFIYFGKDYN